MAREFHGKIPKIPIDADTSKADAKVDQLFKRVEGLQHIKIDADISQAQRRLETLVKRTNSQLSSALVGTMLKDFKTVLGAMKTEFESFGDTSSIYKGLEKTCNMVEERFANLTISVDKKQISGLTEILNTVVELQSISNFEFGEVVSKQTSENAKSVLHDVKATKNEINSIASKVDYIQKTLNKNTDGSFSTKKLQQYKEKLHELRGMLKGFYSFDDNAIQNTLVNITAKINEALGEIEIRIPKVEDGVGIISTKKTKEELDMVEKELQSIQLVVNRISTNSSINGLKNLEQEAVNVTKLLAEMYDEGIRDTERYITLQYKLQKIFDKMGKSYGGVRGSGSKDHSELLDLVVDGIYQRTGENIFGSNDMGRVMENLFGSADFSLFNKSLDKLGMKGIAHLLLLNEKTGDWVDMQKQVTVEVEKTEVKLQKTSQNAKEVEGTYKTLNDIVEETRRSIYGTDFDDIFSVRTVEGYAAALTKVRDKMVEIKDAARDAKKEYDTYADTIASYTGAHFGNKSSFQKAIKDAWGQGDQAMAAKLFDSYQKKFPDGKFKPEKQFGAEWSDNFGKNLEEANRNLSYYRTQLKNAAEAYGTYSAFIGLQNMEKTLTDGYNRMLQERAIAEKAAAEQTEMLADAQKRFATNNVITAQKNLNAAIDEYNAKVAESNRLLEEKRRIEDLDSYENEPWFNDYEFPVNKIMEISQQFAVAEDAAELFKIALKEAVRVYRELGGDMKLPFSDEVLLKEIDIPVKVDKQDELFKAPKNNYEKLFNTLTLGDNAFKTKSKGEVSGFSWADRETIAEALVNGLQQGLKEINIILNNGKTTLTFAGGIDAASQILDKLGFKAIESEITKFVGKVFKKSDAVKYSYSKDGNYIADSLQLYKLSRPLNELESGAIQNYAPADLLKIVGLSKNMTSTLPANVREALIDIPGGKKGGEPHYIFKTEDGQYIVLRKSAFDNIRQVSSAIKYDPSAFKHSVYASNVFGFGEDGSVVSGMASLLSKSIQAAENSFNSGIPVKKDLSAINDKILDIAGIKAINEETKNLAEAEAKVVPATEKIVKENKKLQSSYEGLAEAVESATGAQEKLNNTTVKYVPVLPSGKENIWGDTDDIAIARDYVHNQDRGFNRGTRLSVIGAEELQNAEKLDEITRQYNERRQQTQNILNQEKLTLENIVYLLKEYNQMYWSKLSNPNLAADAVNLEADIEKRLGSGTSFAWDNYLNTLWHNLEEPTRNDAAFEAYAKAIAKHFDIEIPKAIDNTVELTKKENKLLKEQSEAASEVVEQTKVQAEAEKTAAEAAEKMANAKKELLDNKSSSDDSVEEIVKRDVEEALAQLRSAKNNETTLFSLKGVFEGDDLIDQAQAMIKNIAEQANLALASFNVKDDTIKVKLYNDELKITVDQMYKLRAATEEMEAAQLELVSQSFNQNVKALNENKFDVKGVQQRALASIEKVRSSLHGLEYDLTDLESAARNISSQDDFVKFNNQLKAAQDNIQAIKNSTVSKSSMNPLANMQRDMQNASIEIETMRLKLEKFGDIQGVAEAKQMLDDMTVALRQFNNATNARGQQSAYNQYSNIRSSFKAQTEYINAAKALNDSQQSADKQVDPIRKQYQSILDLINKINIKSNEITKYQAKDGGSGIFAGYIEQLQAEKTRLVSELQGVTSEINNALSSGFIQGKEYSVPFASFLDDAGTISSFLNNTKTQASLTTEEIEKLIAALQKSQNIDINAATKVAEQFKAVQETYQRLSNLTNLDKGNENYQSLANIFGQIAKYKNSLSSDPTSWTPEESAHLQTLIEQFTKYGNILADTGEKEARYFANKQQYISGDTTMSSMAEEAETAASKISSAQSTLTNSANKFAQESGAGGAIVTKFVQSANGISRLDFSVLDRGTNTLRNFQMEMGRASDQTYITETTINKSISNMQSALKQIESAQSTLGRLGFSGANAQDGNAPAQITAVLDKIKQLNAEMTKGDGADQNLVNQYTKDLQIMTKELEKADAQMRKMENLIDNDLATKVGTIDPNGNVYNQLVQQAQQLAAAQGNAALSTGKFDKATNTLDFSLIHASGTVEKMKMSMYSLNGECAYQQTGVGKLTTSWDRFKASLGQAGKQLMTAFAGYNVFYKVISEVRKGIGYVKEIDLALTELKKVTDETEESYAKFLDTAAGTAGEIGSTVSDFTEATANFARLNI